jgi:serine/threonine protein kinase
VKFDRLYSNIVQAQILTRIHHTNLVSMIGYCKDGEYMAVVYEYMSEGTLQEHIEGIYSLCFSIYCILVFGFCKVKFSKVWLSINRNILTFYNTKCILHEIILYEGSNIIDLILLDVEFSYQTLQRLIFTGTNIESRGKHREQFLLKYSLEKLCVPSKKH